MKKLATNRPGVGAAQPFKPTPSVLVLGLAGLISLTVAPSRSLAADPAYTFKVVAAVGDPAPGGGAFTTDFEPSALNNRGQLAFTADLAVPGEPEQFHEGLFLAGGGNLQQIVRFGQSAPGGGTFSVGELG
ncbi:MAG TPA: choice-of-anchor tandem repeat NxxGxxAF-containing protein, partial [Verrucomicrobiae bacterium]|nr:choice-of-anchor tandem repeat NxxGxxAF-containing protein [Verrucomicrobiae bacterium]